MKLQVRRFQLLSEGLESTNYEQMLKQEQLLSPTDLHLPFFGRNL